MKKICFLICFMLVSVITFPQWTWQNPLPQGNTLNSVHFADANTGYAVGVTGTILKTINGGTNWTILSGGTTIDLRSVFFTDPNLGYTVGLEGIILKTTNGGKIWTALSSGTTNNLYSVCFTDPNTGYAVGDSGTILKTLNGGTTWTALSSGTTKNLYSVYFIDVNIGYVTGDSGTILKTSNGGTSWSMLSSGTNNDLLSVYFTDVNTGYVVGAGGTILKTTNGGGYPAGLNDLSSEPQCLKIYPNPASSQITIETSAIPIHSTLSIMNLEGQQLITRQITEPSTSIDVSTLPGGIYFVQITNDRTVAIGKFVKQ